MAWSNDWRTDINRFPARNGLGLVESLNGLGPDTYACSVAPDAMGRRSSHHFEAVLPM